MEATIDALANRDAPPKKVLSDSTIEDILNPKKPKEIPYMVPQKNYVPFAYIDPKAERIHIVKDYMMGPAWGMQNTYSRAVFLAERLVKNAMNKERVRLHEMEEGHDFYRDEIITRINSYTLDTAPFIIYDLHGA